MELLMYLGNDLIESVPLNTAKISEPGYLGSFKRELKQRYSILLQEAPDAPEFLVVNLQPAHSGYTTTVSGYHSSVQVA
jgi:hypothetical protein